MITDASPLPHRSLAWLSIFVALFIVYGSLVPFVYRPATLAQAIDYFAHIPWLDIGEEGRADWVANLVLYLPFGFLACGALSKRSTLFAMAITAILGSILAAGVEFLQIWADPRTVSLNDIVAEIAGTFLGIFAWLAFGERLVRATNTVLRGGSQAAGAAVVLYLLAYTFYSLFPFDFYVSSSEVQARLADPDTFAWLPRNMFSLRGIVSLFLKAVLIMPLGAATALVWRRGALAAAASAFLFSGFLEITHLFEISTRTDAASVAVAVIGALGGNLLARTPIHLERVPVKWLRRLAFAATPVYLLLLPVLRGWTRGHVSREFIAQTLNSMHWLPFYYHYYTSEGHALASVVTISASMVPLGGLAWATGLRTVETAGQKRSYIPVALVALLLSTILEVGGFVTAGERPDPTNVLVAVVAAAISQRMFEWLARIVGEFSSTAAT